MIATTDFLKACILITIFLTPEIRHKDVADIVTRWIAWGDGNVQGSQGGLSCFGW